GHTTGAVALPLEEGTALWRMLAQKSWREKWISQAVSTNVYHSAHGTLAASLRAEHAALSPTVRAPIVNEATENSARCTIPLDSLPRRSTLNWLRVGGCDSPFRASPSPRATRVYHNTYQ